MSIVEVVRGLKSAVADYRAATDKVSDEVDRAEYARLISISETLISELEAGQADTARQTAFAFSRSASDGFAIQPNEFHRLSEIAERIRDMS